MSQPTEHFLELSYPKKVGVVVVALLFIFGGYWLLFYRAVGSEINSVEQILEGPKGVRAKVSEREGVAKNLVKFRAEVQLLNEELNRALAELPDRRETPQLLTKVSERGREVGLDIRSFKPLPQEKRDFYAEVPVEMEVYGTYHQLASFFDQVGRLERIVNLDRFELARHTATDFESSENEVRLRTTVRATTFRFLDESEREEAKQATKKEPRARQKKKGLGGMVSGEGGEQK